MITTLILTHGGLANELLSAAETIVGELQGRRRTRDRQVGPEAVLDRLDVGRIREIRQPQTCRQRRPHHALPDAALAGDHDPEVVRPGAGRARVIEDGLADYRQLARFNGRPAVGISVLKVQNANTVAIIKASDAMSASHVTKNRSKLLTMKTFLSTRGTAYTARNGSAKSPIPTRS